MIRPVGQEVDERGGMDYLGPEFLTWLWWRARVEPEFRHKDGTSVFVHVDEFMEFRGERAAARKTVLRSGMPAASAEGKVSGPLPSWQEYTGQTVDEVQARGWTRALHPDDVPHTMAVWMKAVETRLLYEVDYRLRRRDGVYRFFTVRGVPVLNDDGTAREWVGTCADITDRKRAEAEIRELNTSLEQRVTERTLQLEAANRELEAFSYSVSHDLRAPLRAVDGFSQAVLEDYGGQLPEEGRRYLQTIRAGAQKMGALIDDLLNFSRLNRAPLNKNAVDTGNLVRSVLADLSAEQDGRQIELRIGELPVCAGDRALLRQVWINLLSNALKYTRKREAAVIEVGCEAGAEGDVFFVRDNGTGFDMRYADKLFGVFQRLHRAEEYEGTGVGLAIVQRIIQRHGGRVWTEAAVDRGATFYFTLGGSANP